MIPLPLPSSRQSVTGDGFPEATDTQGQLTCAEEQVLQEVADRVGLPFSVIGERAQGRGRNVNTTLPFGSGPERRSPIELAFPAEYDLITRGEFTEALYGALDAIFGTRRRWQGIGPDGLPGSGTVATPTVFGDRGYWQASHLYPFDGPSIDFYPRKGQRTILR